MFNYRLLLLLAFLFMIGCSAASEDTHDHTEHGEAHTDENAEHGEAHDEAHDENHDGEHREHDAHEHGVAEMNMAWSEETVLVELSSPAFNVVGFEYEPVTDAEKSAVEEGVIFLEQGDFLQFNESANCTVASAEVETTFDEEEGEETHSDMDVSYTIECADFDKLESVDLADLFAQFPNFEELQFQWVSDTQQSASLITSDNAVISFE